MKIEGIYSLSQVVPAFSYGVQAGPWQDGELQQIVVIGSHIPESMLESLRIGTKTAKQDIYAVYLIAPKKP